MDAFILKIMRWVHAFFIGTVVAATILESFIQAQKVSVRRALRRGFRKYLADPSDFFALLLVELQKMVSFLRKKQRSRAAWQICFAAFNDRRDQERKLGITSRCGGRRSCHSLSARPMRIQQFYRSDEEHAAITSTRRVLHDRCIGHD